MQSTDSTFFAEIVEYIIDRATVTDEELLRRSNMPLETLQSLKTKPPLSMKKTLLMLGHEEHPNNRSKLVRHLKVFP